LSNYGGTNDARIADYLARLAFCAANSSAVMRRMAVKV
jgi:hypothetical protein